MESVEALIPDNKGNHLVVVLNFCDDNIQDALTQVPKEFSNFATADISIRKLFEDQPLSLSALYKMSNWIIEQLRTYSNTVFWFICSTKGLNNNHPNLPPAQYRWELFEFFYQRNKHKLKETGIESQEFIVGSGAKTNFIRVFYRIQHAPIIHIVAASIKANHEK